MSCQQCKERVVVSPTPSTEEPAAGDPAGAGGRHGVISEMKSQLESLHQWKLSTEERLSHLQAQYSLLEAQNKLLSRRCERLEEDMDGVFLYEGGEVAEERRNEIVRVRIGPQVKEIPNKTFKGCINLTAVKFHEGLEIIGNYAFQRSKSALERHQAGRVCI